MNTEILGMAGAGIIVDSDDHAAELQSEYESLCRILQAQSAVHLLRQIGRKSHPNELERSLNSVDSWISEVQSGLNAKSRHNPLATRTLGLVNNLRFAQRRLRRELSSSAPKAEDRDVLPAIRSTHDRLRHLFSSTSLQSAFLSSGCACEFSLIAENRSDEQ